MKLFISNTIAEHEDSITQTSRRLTEALLYYKSMINQHEIFREEDHKLFYKTFINEIRKLGFLKGEEM